MSFEFDAATAVELESPGFYRGSMAEGWGVWDTLNGGYVAAVAARAMAHAADRPDPVSLSVHFVRPAAVGPVQVETTVLGAGRRLTRVAATLRQRGETIAALLGTFGTVPTPVAGAYRDRLPDLPSRPECVTPDRMALDRATVGDRIDALIAPADAGFLAGAPTGVERITSWIRFADSRHNDALGMVFLVDAMPPPAFNRSGTPQWLPTVALTVHIPQAPGEGWLRLLTKSQSNRAGMVTEHCVIYDESGATVATASQLAISRPEAPEPTAR